MSQKDKIPQSLYSSIHHWIKNKYGKASKCEGKDCTGISTYYCWALKKGKEYDYKRINFVQLCGSCHAKYDTTDEKRRKMRELNENTYKKYCKRGHLLSAEKCYIRTVGDKKWRVCRMCRNLHGKYYKKRNKLALSSGDSNQVSTQVETSRDENPKT